MTARTLGTPTPRLSHSHRFRSSPKLLSWSNLQQITLKSIAPKGCDRQFIEALLLYRIPHRGANPAAHTCSSIGAATPMKAAFAACIRGGFTAWRWLAAARFLRSWAGRLRGHRALFFAHLDLSLVPGGWAATASSCGLDRKRG